MEFERREIALLPGCARPYVEGEWRDALVTVKSGTIELEGLSGNRYRFDAGAILWFDGLPLRAVHNCGRQTAFLGAISRRR